MDDQQLPAGIEVGRMRGSSSVTDVLSINNAGPAVRVGEMDDISRVQGITQINNVDVNLAELIEAVKALNSREAMSELEQFPRRSQDVGYWKGLIDKVGAVAGKVAVKVLTGTALEAIKQYLQSKGITLPD